MADGTIYYYRTDRPAPGSGWPNGVEIRQWSYEIVLFGMPRMGSLRTTPEVFRAVYAVPDDAVVPKITLGQL